MMILSIHSDCSSSVTPSSRTSEKRKAHVSNLEERPPHGNRNSEEVADREKVSGDLRKLRSEGRAVLLQSPK
jgi:hypothetical protein